VDREWAIVPVFCFVRPRAVHVFVPGNCCVQLSISIQVDTRVVTTRRAIKVQRHSIFRHLDWRTVAKEAYMCIVRTPKTYP
jgi:hypothetical protein